MGGRLGSGRSDEGLGGGEVVDGDEVGESGFGADVEFAEVFQAEGMVAANLEDALDVAVADAGDAEERFPGGAR